MTQLLRHLILMTLTGSTIERPAFFYGTLMAEPVLARVISGQLKLDPSLGLSIHPAHLEGYRRHCVRNVDYPAVVADESAVVNGTVVYGLSDEVIERLDVFEGDEYRRDGVPVIDTEKGVTVEANLYLWIGGADRLLDKDWDFDDFVNNRMDKWIADQMDLMDRDPLGNRFWDVEAVSGNPKEEVVVAGGV